MDMLSARSAVLIVLIAGTAQAQELSFSAMRSFDALINEPRTIATGDFNGDGVRDLVVASENVAVLQGNGDGTFQSAREIPVSGFSNSIAVGDFNGDRVLDLAVAHSNNLSILLGNGDGTFQPPRDVSVANSFF